MLESERGAAGQLICARVQVQWCHTPLPLFLTAADAVQPLRLLLTSCRRLVPYASKSEQHMC